MRAKQVYLTYLTGNEKLIVQTMISLEIKSNIKCKEMGISPAFDTATMKALYKKLAGREWEEDQRR